MLIKFCDTISDEILNGADEDDVAFLVVGDPFGLV
jgi:diphthamide biosynthesis methyltransferase